MCKHSSISSLSHIYLQTAQAHQSSIEKEVNSLCLTTATVVTSIPNLHKQGMYYMYIS